MNISGCGNVQCKHLEFQPQRRKEVYGQKFFFQDTVQPPSKGQVCSSADVHYSEVVLYWGAFTKNYFTFWVILSK